MANKSRNKNHSNNLGPVCFDWIVGNANSVHTNVQELDALSSYLRYNYYQLVTHITELNESRSRFAHLHMQSCSN